MRFKYSGINYSCVFEDAPAHLHLSVMRSPTKSFSLCWLGLSSALAILLRVSGVQNTSYVTFLPLGK